jgi:hypothetical protein
MESSSLEALLKKIKALRPTWVFYAYAGTTSKIVFGPEYGPEAYGYVFQMVDGMNKRELFDTMIYMYGKILTDDASAIALGNKIYNG